MNTFRKVIVAVALAAAAAAASSPAVAKPKCTPGVTKVEYWWIHNQNGEKVGCLRIVEKIDGNCNESQSIQHIRTGACRGRANN